MDPSFYCSGGSNRRKGLITSYMLYIIIYIYRYMHYFFSWIPPFSFVQFLVQVVKSASKVRKVRRLHRWRSSEDCWVNWSSRCSTERGTERGTERHGPSQNLGDVGWLSQNRHAATIYIYISGIG